jgi:hypothetical protein
MTCEGFCTRCGGDIEAHLVEEEQADRVATLMCEARHLVSSIERAMNHTARMAAITKAKGWLTCAEHIDAFLYALSCAIPEPLSRATPLSERLAHLSLAWSQ